jgi:hypothetical protein
MRRCWTSTLLGLQEILGAARTRRSARSTALGCTPSSPQDCMGYGRVGVVYTQVPQVIVVSTEV